jgi:ribose 5-phosphate isomerase A
VSTDVERERRLAAEAAAALVEEGMVVGLGTGSTASYFVSALGARALDIRCVATSPATEQTARAAGLHVESFDGAAASARIDLAVDGADQVARNRWVVKGGGGAHTREKIVAAAAARFVVIVSSDKLVEAVGPPVPLELLEFGLAATLARLANSRVRGNAPRTPDDGVLADWTAPFRDPAELAWRLAADPGVVEHGLFPPDLVSEVILGRSDGVERL